MAHRNTFASPSDAADAVRNTSPEVAKHTGIVDYLGLAGLALAAILLIGFVANVVFGSSVSTTL